MAFIVATPAEWGATDRARREDVTEDQVHVRGTKRDTRDRVVPLVFPDQFALVEFASKRVGARRLAPGERRARLPVRRACAERGDPMAVFVLRLVQKHFQDREGQWDLLE